MADIRESRITIPDYAGKDRNVLALVKGDEHYVFVFYDDQGLQTLRTLGRFASNPDLSFTWYDAAVLSQKIRATAQPATKSERFNLPLTEELGLDDAA